MAHVEPAHLVELALRNAVPTEADTEALRHVEQCDRCRDELRVLTRLVTAARSAKALDLPTPPPDHVWHDITRKVSQEPTPPQGDDEGPDSRTAPEG
ncbi:hypothetical protein [Streptomyces indiaensis]|uniref:Zinc-finger n=1 Tax=Streptomyces indiaensis TaxID=284033 RepID=A0ABN3EH62_9ACTN|nr:hypothetical protein [Streptomyces indiaensis]MCF1646125.1 hypothetical protein [Streptomyces indiaensis]